MGSIPFQGTKCPHSVEQLSPSTTTRESMHHDKKISYDAMKIPHATAETQWIQIKKIKYLKNNNKLILKLIECWVILRTFLEVINLSLPLVTGSYTYGLWGLALKFSTVAFHLKWGSKAPLETLNVLNPCVYTRPNLCDSPKRRHFWSRSWGWKSLRRKKVVKSFILTPSQVHRFLMSSPRWWLSPASLGETICELGQQWGEAGGDTVRGSAWVLLLHIELNQKSLSSESFLLTCLGQMGVNHHWRRLL